MGLVINCAKTHVPRGVRKTYIPGWNKKCEQLYQLFKNTGNKQTAESLLKTLDFYLECYLSRCSAPAEHRNGENQWKI